MCYVILFLVELMKKSLEISLISVFVCLENAIFVFVYACPEYDKASYAATCLAFVFAFFYAKKDARIWLTIAALMFTVVSDYFLVLRMPFDQPLAMTTFLAAQLCYATRLMLNENKKLRIVDIVLRVSLSVMMIIVAKIVLAESFDYLSSVSLVYFVNLFLNVIFSFIQFKKSPILAIGLLLFMFCDIVVGLNSSIGVYIDVPPSSIWYIIAHTPFNLANIFYMPSQTLIALSCRDCK